jgi:hypothetical protein
LTGPTEALAINDNGTSIASNEILAFIYQPVTIVVVAVVDFFRSGVSGGIAVIAVAILPETGLNTIVISVHVGTDFGNQTGKDIC